MTDTDDMIPEHELTHRGVVVWRTVPGRYATTAGAAPGFLDFPASALPSAAAAGQAYPAETADRARLRLAIDRGDLGDVDASAVD